MLFLTLQNLQILVPNVSTALQINGVQIFSGITDLIMGAIPLVIGILVIILIVGAAIILLPAIIVGALIWFLTGSFFLAGIAFLVVAVLSLATLI